MSFLPSSLFIFLVYVWMHSCNAPSSARLLNPDSAENKVVDKVEISNMNHVTNVGDIDVTKASMMKTEEYSLNMIEGQVKKMKVNGRKEAMDDKTNLGFDSADYPQPRTHPPSHN